jgi:hypothetical protein
MASVTIIIRSVPVDDEAAPGVPAVERRAHRTRITAGERRHGVVEMREAAQPMADCFHDGVVVAGRMTGADQHAGRGEARNGFHAVALGRQRHQGPAFGEGGHNGDVLILHRPHEGGIMHALALRADEGPLQVNAEHAGNAGCQRLAHGLHGLDHGFTGIRDEGRQEARGAVGPVRLSDGPDAVDGANVVVENAAAAIDLNVDEAGSEQTLDPAAFDARAEIALMRDTEDAAAIDHHGTAVEHMRPVEDAGSGERDGHQTVSVTLRRRGGLSGLRPRARAMAFTRG